MKTVNFYLKDPKAKKKTLIYLFFSFRGQRLKYSTGESVHPKYWNESSQRVRGDDEVNDFLKSIAAKVESLERTMRTNGEPLTPQILRQKLKDHYNEETTQEYNLISFVDEYIHSIQDSKKLSTIKGYKNTLRHLKEYSSNLKFEEITLDFYNSFTKFLAYEKGFQINTIGKQIKNIKAFLTEATDRGLNKSTDFRNKKFKVISEEADTIYLNEEEIRKIYNLPLEDNKRLDQVRDLFIIGCYTGLRFSDFSQIRPEHIKGEQIHIRTQKTDKVVVVPIHPMVKQIMLKYKDKYANSMPPAISNQKMNQYLKEIGKLAELTDKRIVTKSRGVSRVDTTLSKYESVTTHTARRSFATNLYLADFPAISIMGITGHQSERAFLKYIKVTPEQHASKLGDFWKNRTI